MNLDYIKDFEQSGMHFVGRDVDGERMEIMEIKGMIDALVCKEAEHECWKKGLEINLSLTRWFKVFNRRKKLFLNNFKFHVCSKPNSTNLRYGVRNFLVQCNLSRARSVILW